MNHNNESFGERILPISMLEIWILLASLTQAAGWMLSALHQLNAVSYSVLYLTFAVLLFLGIRMGRVRFVLPPARLRRFRRLLPAFWLGLAVLVFAGGALHAPNNYDYLTYRFPRVLHWAWEQQWHWIGTGNDRLNYSAPLYEWLMTPLFVLFKTDRLFFLINILSFLFLPGLIFWVFRLLDVARRSAWICMWLLPSGYCYVIQAGSVGNDSFAAVFLLASIGYALRARRNGSFPDLCFSLLSAALLTGAKASNLPLLLPCLVALGPSWRVFMGRPLATCGILVLGATVSFLPMGVMNHFYAGHWSGDPDNLGRMQLEDPVAGIIGNTLQIGLGALAPPVFPASAWWNAHVWGWVPDAGRLYLKKEFPRLGLGLGELPVEEGAGLGLGLTLFMICLILRQGRNSFNIRWGAVRAHAFWISNAAFIAFAVYMAKMGSESGARIAASYYLLVLASLFVVFRWQIPRSRFFSGLAVIVLLSAYPVVILTPARPLLPLATLTNELKEAGWGHPVLDRAAKVYRVYANRADGLAPARRLIPEEVREIGFYQSGDDSEVALWRPWGSRRVVDWQPGSKTEWLVASSAAIRHKFNQSAEEWAWENGYKIVSQTEITSKVQEGPVKWLLIRKASVVTGD